MSGLGIMTIFLIRMKKREKKLKKQNASNKTVEMDGVKKVMDKNGPDPENGNGKYTSIATDKSVTPNTTTGSASGGNYNELPSLNPITESSPGNKSLLKFHDKNCLDSNIFSSRSR